MLRQVAEGVLVHQSEFMQSNAVVVLGPSGVLLIDAGITSDELGALAGELVERRHAVVAGFSTHPHWDHLLWHADLGAPPRYGTARCAATVRERLPDAAAKARVTQMMPPELADRVPLDLLGNVTGLPAGAAEVPWDGPRVRVIEHQAHAPGHATLFIEQSAVLVAGDLLSDLLIPMLDVSAADPVEDHLVALQLIEDAAGDAEVVIPGHGSVGGPGQARTRIDQDRAYVRAVRDPGVPDDPRLSGDPEWVLGIHERQQQALAGK